MVSQMMNQFNLNENSLDPFLSNLINSPPINLLSIQSSMTTSETGGLAHQNSSLAAANQSIPTIPNPRKKSGMNALLKSKGKSLKRRREAEEDLESQLSTTSSNVPTPKISQLFQFPQSPLAVSTFPTNAPFQNYCNSPLNPTPFLASSKILPGPSTSATTSSQTPNLVSLTQARQIAEEIFTKQVAPAIPAVFSQSAPDVSDMNLIRLTFPIHNNNFSLSDIVLINIYQYQFLNLFDSHIQNFKSNFIPPVELHLTIMRLLNSMNFA